MDNDEEFEVLRRRWLMLLDQNKVIFASRDYDQVIAIGTKDPLGRRTAIQFTRRQAAEIHRKLANFFAIPQHKK